MIKKTFPGKCGGDVDDVDEFSKNGEANIKFVGEVAFSRMIGDWVGQALNPQRVCESKGSPHHTNPPNPQALLSEIFVLRLPMDPRPADQKFPKICEKSRKSVKSRGALGRGFCELE